MFDLKNICNKFQKKKTSAEELLPPIKVPIFVDFAFKYVCKSNQSGQFNLLGVRA